MERSMSGKMIKIASAALIGATLLGTGTSTIAAPVGITPRAAVAASSPVTDVQWRRWGGGWGYRRGWGGWGWGAPVGAAIGLGVLGAAAAAASSPYYYGYGYPYGYGYAYPYPYYYGW